MASGRSRAHLRPALSSAWLRTSRPLVPPLWVLEVANVLAVGEATRPFLLRGPKLPLAPCSLVEQLLGETIETISPPVTFRQVLTSARFRLTAYDAVYLEVARSEGVPLATLDHGLQAAAPAAGVELFLNSNSPSGLHFDVDFPLSPFVYSTNRGNQSILPHKEGGTMKLHLLSGTILLLIVTASVWATDTSNPTDSAAALAQLKSLAGDWESKAPDGKVPRPIRGRLRGLGRGRTFRKRGHGTSQCHDHRLLSRR